MKQFNITINFDDYTVKTQMLSQTKNISVENDRIYMWYGSQKIIETKGGYDGKLIHGTYRSFYLNNQLREQGQIRYGLRHKQWKYWYSDGQIREVIQWKNGIKSGPYYLYNDFGQLMAKGNFKKDKLNGKFYTYGPTGTVTDKKKYKNGNEIIAKVKKEKIKKEKDKKLPREKKQKQETKDSQENQKPSWIRKLFKNKSSEKSLKKSKVEKKKVITS